MKLPVLYFVILGIFASFLFDKFVFGVECPVCCRDIAMHGTYFNKLRYHKEQLEPYSEPCPGSKIEIIPENLHTCAACGRQVFQKNGLVYKHFKTVEGELCEGVGRKINEDDGAGPSSGNDGKDKHEGGGKDHTGGTSSGSASGHQTDSFNSLWYTERGAGNMYF